MPLSSSPPLPAPSRELLRRFALQWAQLGLGSAQRLVEEDELAPEVVYVEPFAGEDGPLVPPVLPCGVSVAARLLGALAGGVTVGRMRLLLSEEDPVKVDWLTQAVDTAELGAHLRVEREDGESGAGPLWIRQGDWLAWDGLPALLGEAREALVVLDPPAAGRLPWDALRTVLQAPRAEVVVRFPTAELRRLARYRGSPLADLPPYEKRAVEGLSRLLGDRRHEWFFAWRARLDAGETEAAGRQVMAALLERLRSARGRVHRMTIPVPDQEPEDLLLVGPRASRAYSLNQLVYEARCEGWLSWPESEGGFVRYVQSGELQLFGAPGAGARRERLVDRTQLAHATAERFAGRTLEYGEVLARLADADLFEEDVRRALGELRRDGRALFRSLATEEATVAFPSSRVRGRAATRRRRGDPGAELDLALDPTEE